MNMPRLSMTLSLLALVSATSAAQAESTLSANLNASATIEPMCQTLTAGELAFGTYNPLADTDTEATAEVTVNCTKGTTVTLALDAGSTTGADYSQRLLGNGDETLNYNLFSSADHSQVLDDTNTLSDSGAGLTSALTFTVFGMIPKGQLDVAPGSYTDSVTLTVAY